MEKGGAAGALFRFLNKMADIIILSIVFVLTCIPVVTIGTSGTALYYTVQKVVKRDHGYLLKEYFRSFKENFKQTLLIWLVMLLIALASATAFLMLNEYRIMGYFFGNFFVIPGAILLLLAAYAIHVFAYIARFEGTTKDVLKTSAQIAIMNLPKTVACTIIFFASIVAILYVLPLFIIIPAVACLLINVMLESIYRKYMSDEELAAEEEKDNEEKSPM